MKKKLCIHAPHKLFFPSNVVDFSTNFVKEFLFSSSSSSFASCVWNRFIYWCFCFFHHKYFQWVNYLFYAIYCNVVQQLFFLQRRKIVFFVRNWYFVMIKFSFNGRIKNGDHCSILKIIFFKQLQSYYFLLHDADNHWFITINCNTNNAFR